MLEAGAKIKEETWQLLITSMRMVSISSTTRAAHWAHSIQLTISSFLFIFFTLDFVASYLKDLKLPTWIGLSDLLVENQYAWCDGDSPVLYTNWNEHEPNNVGGTVRIL